MAGPPSTPPDAGATQDRAIRERATGPHDMILDTGLIPTTGATVAHERPPAPDPTARLQGETGVGTDVLYPREIADFSAWLLRNGYIRSVESLLPVAWRAMTEVELTRYLAAHYPEQDLKKMFLSTYDKRQAIKAAFRGYHIITALVIGLVWARENVQEGKWDEALMKVGGAGITAYALNKMLYARDPSAATIMASKGKQFGRWFKGASRTNPFVNRLTGALAIADVAQLFKSGGYDLPTIPWDIIVDIDINDETTWLKPNQKLLDFGFNIWYRQKCTKVHPEACAGNVYYGYVEGSLIKGMQNLIKELLSQDWPQQRSRLGFGGKV